MHRMIRTAVRSWLRLPKDTPLGFLYAPTIEGGLNIPSLLTNISLMRRRRMEKLLRGEDDISKNTTSTPQHFAKVLRAINQQIRVGPEIITNKTEAKRSWSNLLHSVVNGRELQNTDIVPANHRWLTLPQRIFPRLHLRGIQLRGGVLPSKARKQRGRGGAKAELNNHIHQARPGN